MIWRKKKPPMASWLKPEPACVRHKKCAIVDAPHELSVGAPRPAPEASLAEGLVAQVGEARHDLEAAVLVGDARALVVVDDRLVAGQGGVYVEAAALARPQLDGLGEDELDHVVARGWVHLVRVRVRVGARVRAGVGVGARARAKMG